MNSVSLQIQSNFEYVLLQCMELQIVLPMSTVVKLYTGIFPNQGYMFFGTTVLK